jgi:hypothetical protein
MKHNGSIVLVACQVDDFALANIDEDQACSIVALIGERIRLPSKDVIPINF